MNFKKVANNIIPNHVAIILDGNGRWAKKRGMPRTYGHEKGAENLIKIISECSLLGVKELTVFAFSTENWNRPSAEVDFLMNEPIRYLDENIDRLQEVDIKINFIGRRDRIPTPTLDSMNKVMDLTKENTKMILNVAFDYGGRNDILEAVKIISGQVSENIISLEEIDEKYINENLLLSSEVDLLIRTSGELRISNFLLWQSAYAEFYFTKCLWPDFSKKELYKAVASYQKRKRRFGGLNIGVKK